MISRRTRAFRKLFVDLPPEVQREAKAAYGRFRRNPFHPSLHFRELETWPDVWTVRIGIHWRALAKREGQTLHWFWIGSHADYDKLIS